MATDGTWIGDPTLVGEPPQAAYLTFDIVSNWTAGQVASGTGATITLAPADNSYVPTTNQPTEGTFNFIVASAVTVTLDNWLNGALVGNVVVNDMSADVTCTAAVTGTTTVTAGALTASGNLGDNPADTVVIGEQGFLNVLAAITIAGAVTNDNQFNIRDAVAVTCAGLFTNNDLVDGMAGSSIDFNGGVAGGGTWGTSADTSKLTLVSSGDFILTSATWNVAPDSTLTIDNTATVNLGTTEAIANLAIIVLADVSLAGHLPATTAIGGGATSGSLTLTGGAVHNLGTTAKGGTGGANAITYAGQVNVGGDQTLADLAVDGGDARISGAAASKSLIGTSATSITHGRARIRGYPHPLTLTGLDTNWGAGKQRIRAWRCVDGGGNGDRVQFRRGHNLRAHSLDRSD